MVSKPTKQQLKAHHRKAVEWAARAGYFARAAIYVIIGFLASLLLILGGDGQITDAKGAIRLLYDSPFGFYLILLLGLGLIGYSLWRFYQSLFDADNHGHDLKGGAIRTGLLISALSHAGLAYYCFNILWRFSQSEGGHKKGMVATALAWPGGEILVGMIGVVVIGFGVAQAVKAYKKGYRKYIHFPHNSQILDWVSRAGLSARALIFAAMGSSLLFAAWSSNANQTKDTKEVWGLLAQLPFGNLILCLLALGLLLFGFYSAIEGSYRKVNVV